MRVERRLPLLSRRLPLLLALAALPLASAHCRGLDRAALIKLYEMTGGAHWRNNQNWNVTSGTALENKNNDPCDLKKRWYGVGFTDPCEPLLDDIIGQGPDADYLTELRGAGMGCFAGRVTSLALPRNNMTGNFSIPELGDLANLTYLDLSWNSLGGAIPTEMGRINNIQIVNLGFNRLEGTIPTELGNINSGGPQPGGRWGAGCTLDDPCPEGENMKISDLTLSNNQLVGPIPPQLSNLSWLRILDLGRNNLSGAVPVELGELTELQVFYVRENRLSGTIPPGLFSNFGRLRYLMMQENLLEGAVPSTVRHLKELEYFHLFANMLNEQLPEEIGEMGQVRDLRIQDNQIPGSIPYSIGNLTNLEYLDIYNNRMTGDVPASIAELINLKELYLQNEHLKPVRQRYCRTRIPNVGKMNWRQLRDEYHSMVSYVCPDMHDTEFTFNSLQASSSYDATT